MTPRQSVQVFCVEQEWRIRRLLSVPQTRSAHGEGRYRAGLRWAIPASVARRTVPKGNGAVLTAETVREIRRRMKDAPRGTARRLAFEYEVSFTTIGEIARRATWRDLPEEES